MTPINFDEKDDASATIGAVVLLRTVSESSNGQKRRMQVMHSGSFDDLVAKSAKMRHVVEQAQRMAKWIPRCCWSVKPGPERCVCQSLSSLQCAR